MHAIYKIENVKNGKIYIGSAVNHDQRRWVHLCVLRKGKHHSPILQNSWNKYGKNAFLFSVLEEVSNKKDLIKREQYWIDKLNPEFNCCPIAGSPLGRKYSAQAIENFRKGHIGLTEKERGHKKNCKCCICHHLKGEKKSKLYS